MSILAGIILAFYQLIGLQHGPGQQHLQQALIKTRTQPALEQPPTVTYTYHPLKTPTSQTLSLSATSAYAVDVDSMTPLFQKDSQKPLPIASLTKMTTALVALKTYTPDQIITVPALPPYQIDDTLLRVSPGEQFKFDQLLSAALIPSANDAADSLAIASAGSVSAFSNTMNRTLAEWGIGGSHFTNPSGLSDINNYATAESLAKIAKLGLSNSLFAKITTTAQTTITNTQGKVYNLTSTNELLGSDARISGIKTGFTPAAGQCFVGLATIKGHRVITVVLGSSNRFGETRQLLDWIERSWDWL